MSIEKFLKEVKVQKKVWETSDTCTFVFESQDSVFSEYTPGQFITIFSEVNGESISRSYSFSSSPDVDTLPQVTIKRVDNGKMSNFLLDKIDEGDTLKVAPPAGHFFKLDRLQSKKCKSLFLVGAGSGITPLTSVIKHAIKDSSISVCLLDCNRTQQDIIFNRLFSEYQTSSEQFEAHHFLSREPDGKRLGVEEIKKHYIDHLKSKNLNSEDVDVYLCGRDDFMNMVTETLQSCGHPGENIFQESFTATNDANLENLNQTIEDENLPQVFVEYLPDDFESVENKDITAVIEGDTVTIENGGEDNLLEALLNAGEAPPFSCMAGSCSACLCQLNEGKVLQRDIGILSEAEVASGKFLSCQSVGVSSKVKFEYLD